ncbi:MAG TPA: ethanolamine ammonia-lyase subunit EutB [Pirellulales bacterium]|jgi:ethanolamine ammonia-lyase large subunit|nr:ethanolamine ammonia-lyase subunit EutB [Pirellulales bacterium]
MTSPTALEEIVVPVPAPDEVYRTSLLGEEFTFHGLKRLLGAADVSKAGDRGAGLAARSEVEREAARAILSSLTLEHLYEHPLTDDRGEVDSVMRVNYDIDRPTFERMARWPVGQLKDFLLEAPPRDVQSLGFGLTGVMAAAVAKLMDTHELVYAARRFQRPSRARTRLGLPGTLSSRLQPNHPSDDLRSITWLIYAGFSLGGGDALIGVNPAIDTVANVSAILRQIDKVRRECGAPTQVCVLAHVKTQLACLDEGAPVEIMFQSLAGTEATLTSEFDVTVDLLDHAWHTMRQRGPLAGEAGNVNCMYFETGQGSEYTYGKHQGIDMTTTEALCYGLARRYRPFMVNNVTGFIGPETHVDNFEMIMANLQDHFMGKLLGLPMGMAPCYTLHSQITLDGQQMATQLVATAGANYYMDVCLNTDRMLAYFDASAHDSQTLRELHGRTTTPEFLEWAVERGIFRRAATGEILRGPNWGNPRIFCGSEGEYQSLLRATPAVPGFTHAGPRPANDVSRPLRLHQAKARAAIHSELDLDLLRRLAPFRIIHTEAHNKEEHLHDPGLGARLAAADAAALKLGVCDVQIVVSDGLSAEAVHANIEGLLPVLLDGLESRQIALGELLAARYGRVKLAEGLAERTGARLTVLLIGERPGGDALAAQSLSAYLVYQLLEADERQAAAQFSKNPNIRFEYTVVSNIYSGGLPAVEAGALLVERVCQILEHRAAGNRLEALIGREAKV